MDRIAIEDGNITLGRSKNAIVRIRNEDSLRTNPDSEIANRNTVEPTYRSKSKRVSEQLGSTPDENAATKLSDEGRWFFEKLEWETTPRYQDFVRAMSEAAGSLDKTWRIHSNWKKYVDRVADRCLQFEEEHRGTWDGFAVLKTIPEFMPFAIDADSNTLQQSLDRIAQHYIERNAEEMNSFLHTLEELFFVTAYDPFLETVENTSPHPEVQAAAIIVQLIRGRELLRMKPKLPRLREEVSDETKYATGYREVFQQLVQKLENTDADQLRVSVHTVG